MGGVHGSNLIQTVKKKMIKELKAKVHEKAFVRGRRSSESVEAAFDDVVGAGEKQLTQARLIALETLVDAL